jgi:hypothetical protein
VSNTNAFNLMLYGLIVGEQLLIAAYFYRFWRASRDRLFAFFTIGFLVMAVHRVLLGFTLAGSMDLEQQTPVFMIRLLAYALIFTGVVLKNARRER